MRNKDILTIAVLGLFVVGVALMVEERRKATTEFTCAISGMTNPYGWMIAEAELERSGEMIRVRKDDRIMMLRRSSVHSCELTPEEDIQK